jgi:hypothetical protein
VPYVRLGPPPAHRQRFSRPLGLVPELDMTNPGTQFASLQDNAVSRARLALRQLTWLEHATRPQNFDGAFLFAS